MEKAVPSNGTLDQKEYLADDFRINSFKVTIESFLSLLSWGS